MGERAPIVGCTQWGGLGGCKKPCLSFEVRMICVYPSPP